MRFLSKYGAWAIVIRPGRAEAFAGGGVRVLQEEVSVKFAPGLMEAAERELAVARWNFNGSYQELDEVTIVPPDYRIGLFDTQLAQAERGWDDELREEVEGVLLDHAARYDDVLAVPLITVPPPWPTYDDYVGTVEDLMKKILEDGYSWDEVLLYERASQDRDEVVGALEELIAGPRELEEVVG
jgi:hypothetical protein